MKSLQKHQVGKYNCLQLLSSAPNMQTYKGCHAKDLSLVLLRVYDRKNIAQQLDEIRDEVELFIQCRGDHILRFIEKIQTNDLYIVVTDFHELTLEDQIRTKGGFQEVDAIRILKHVVKGLSSLHHQNLVHRTLQPKHISKVGEVYVINSLRSCKKLSSQQQKKIHQYHQIVVAPEILKGLPSGLRSDIWSFGILFYRLMLRDYPTIGQNGVVLDKVMNKLSRNSIRLLEQTVVNQPKKRINWQDVITHPIFVNQSCVFVDYRMDLDLDDQLKMYRGKDQMEISQGKQIGEIELNRACEIKLNRAQTTNVQILEIPQSKLKESFNKLEGQEAMDSEVIAYAEKLRFYYKKSMFFFEQVYKSFVKENIQVPQRLNAQFRFLILTRSFFILSPIHNLIENGKNVFNWKFYDYFRNHSLCIAFLQQFHIHYNQIRKLKQKTEKELSEIENRYSTRVTDFLWKFNNNAQYETYQKFLVGLQGVDYQKQELVEFLERQYITPILSFFETNKMNSKIVVRLKQALNSINSMVSYEDKDRLLLDGIFKRLPKT